MGVVLFSGRKKLRHSSSGWGVTDQTEEYGPNWIVRTKLEHNGPDWCITDQTGTLWTRLERYGSDWGVMDQTGALCADWGVLGLGVTVQIRLEYCGLDNDVKDQMHKGVLP